MRIFPNQLSFGGDVDVARHLSEGTYGRPQDPALLPVGAELGIEAVARVPAKAAIEFPDPAVVVLVGLPLTGVDDRAGLTRAVICIHVVAGGEGTGVCEGFCW